MQLILSPTTKIVTVNGVPCRVWEGISNTGIECHAFMCRVMVDKDSDTSEFEKELKEQMPPSVDVSAIPLRLIL